MVIITLVMTILRFLLNEKGRVTPDGLRFMRSAHIFPEIDNTITPLGYILSIKFFTFFGLDEFWSSKLVGIFSFLLIILIAKKTNFYLREVITTCSLFGFVSVFAATFSETLTLFSIFILLYIAHLIIKERLTNKKALLYLSLGLILIFNIRYSALFIIGATGLFGLLSFKKNYGKTFVLSAIFAGFYIIFYKFLFIDYFNKNYVDDFLEIGLKPTSLLLTEFEQGLATSFNPFVHISNPGGGIINWGIYGIGFFNILLIAFLFIRTKLSETEKYMILIGFSGIVCSFLIQYFYSTDALGYRLLCPFTFPIWLVYFKKLFNIFGTKIYLIGALSLLTGFAFTWLSKGNYLQNRKEISNYLRTEKLDKVPLKFYVKDLEDLENVQISELIGTVNSDIDFTFKAEDTLKKSTLTPHKVLQKIKLDKNKYQ
ncbi:hypothetical protein [Chryseobacterium luquanense]|uniref:Glycosyltransferase RgtA/B/C/D-like domain-containing protein n=1 Tax=Chryseobacterium luquanense TaxID=2983766 RepID=A0ABT3XZI0_9FLAO|nr:hypothetical protein [Chryseobacterium luquanense]MCX8531273.1 hypothetical protein [Chryseobacterium luquanense]